MSINKEMSNQTFVIKRNQSREPVNFNKVQQRLEYLKDYPTPLVDVNIFEVAQNVIQNLKDGMLTIDIDRYSAKVCANLMLKNPEYGILAGRIEINNHHKNTLKSYKDKVDLLYFRKDDDGVVHPLVSDEFYKFVKKNFDKIDAAIHYERDYLLDFFGFKTLENGYLMHVNKKLVERPQDLFMRVAIQMHINTAKDNAVVLERIFRTYDQISSGYYTHATPTLFNAGTPRCNLASCFKGDTQVFTTSGYKAIKDVCIGDMVVTHKGRLKPVVQLHKNPVGDRKVFSIGCYMTPQFQVTGNHKVWIISSEKWNGSPTWNSIEYLRPGDYIAIPKYEGSIKSDVIDVNNFRNFSHHFSHRCYEYVVSFVNDEEYITGYTKEFPQLVAQPLKRFIKIDENFAKFLGIWYGNGSITDRDDESDQQDYGLTITAHCGNKNLIEFVEWFSKEYFGIIVSICKAKTQNCVKLTIASPMLANIFANLFGSYVDGKKFWEPMYDWHTDLVKQLIYGLVLTDGCVSKTGNVMLQMSNPQLTMAVYHLSRRCGMLVSLTETERIKGATCPSYRIEFASGNPAKTPDYKIVDDTIFVRLSKKDLVENFSDEYVYTLGIEDDHSYSVAGIVAQNCYLLGTEDSREGIMHTADSATKISKYSGGIGIHVSDWRATGSLIRGTNGQSGGIVKFLRIYQACALAFDQGGGKRNGSIAIYLEPHHPDFPAFLELRKNEGDEELRCHFLFLAVWASDLFMERVKNDEMWSFFCPDRCKGLSNVYGDEYRRLYLEYENRGMAHSTMKAKELWKMIYASQIESGIPYISYKDTVNRNNMQSNIGVIKSSNLCNEIVLYSDKDNYSVCILASICLPKYVEDTYSPEELELPESERRLLDHKFPTRPVFNYKKLMEITADITQNLNNVIDKTWNPCIETVRTNFRNRPIGIGVQGLADVFAMFRCSFDSDLAKDLNKKIFETIYYASVSQSTKICRDIYRQACDHIRKTGKPYVQTIFPKEVLKQFPELKKEDERVCYEKVEDIPHTIGAYPAYLTNGGSPLANGKFHWELYGLTVDDLVKNSVTGKSMYDWESLRQHIKVYGMKNSHLVALMPTASTSQIMGSSSCFEPYNSNIFRRKTLSGDFIVVNKYLMNDLKRYGLWTEEMKQYLLVNNGSVQGIKELPTTVKNIYKTAFELSQRAIIDLCADRQPFVDQTQSMNLFKENMSFSEFTSMQFYGWNRGLKTGVYYTRGRPATDAQKSTVDHSVEQKFKQGFHLTTEQKNAIESMEESLQKNVMNTIQIYEEDEGCLMCGS